MEDHIKSLRANARACDRACENCLLKSGVPVYGYCITNTHTHVIAHADTTGGIASMMNLAASAVARQLNSRKGREMGVEERERFLDAFRASLAHGSFAKLILGTYQGAELDLVKMIVRPVVIKCRRCYPGVPFSGQK